MWVFNHLHENTAQPCTNQQFHQIWSDYPTCKCISESAKGETTSYFTTSASATTPITHYSDTISAQTSKILAILVALLTVLVVLMIIGWIWTCWVVKKLKTQIESSQTSKYVLNIATIIFLFYNSRKFKKKGCKLKSESGAATTKRGFWWGISLNIEACMHVCITTNHTTNFCKFLSPV